MKYIKSFIEKNSDNIALFLKINRLLFLITTFIYLLLLIINQFWNKIFEEYLNINAIFILLLMSGVFFLFPIIKEEEKFNEKRKLERDDIFLFFIMGIICSILVWIKIKDFGIISYIISGIAGLITLILPILIFYDY
ncbi:unnamed protein product [marine sediment metagenome]|uniref:Uncharacterized protein n=1 Tax=marine sediment metagenome TaxID=412755 RepID=X1P3G1_9ZZZZ